MVSEREVCPRSLGLPAPSLPQFAGGDAVDASALSFLVRQSLLDKEKEKRNKEEEKEVAKAHGGAGGSRRGDEPGSALAGGRRARGERGGRGGRGRCRNPLPHVPHARLVVPALLALRTLDIISMPGAWFLSGYIFLRLFWVAFGPTPCTRQSFARCGVLLRSTRTTVFWETTQCFRISAMLGTTGILFCVSLCGFLEGSSRAPCTWQSAVLCLPRREQENWIFRCHSAALASTTAVVFSGLVLLVMTHFALCSLLLFSGPDARHHGRYEPEGQLRGDILADTPVVHNHRCLWFRLQENWIFCSCSPSCFVDISFVTQLLIPMILVTMKIPSCSS